MSSNGVKTKQSHYKPVCMCIVIAARVYASLLFNSYTILRTWFQSNCFLNVQSRNKQTNAMPCKMKNFLYKMFLSNKMHLKKRYLRYLLPRHFYFWSFLFGLLMRILAMKNYSFKMRFRRMHNLALYRRTYNLHYIQYTTNYEYMPELILCFWTFFWCYVWLMKTWFRERT